MWRFGIAFVGGGVDPVGFVGVKGEGVLFPGAVFFAYGRGGVGFMIPGAGSGVFGCVSL